MQKDETRTTKINAVYSLIARLNSVSWQKNKGLQDDFSLKSLSVSGSRELSNQIVMDFIRFADL